MASLGVKESGRTAFNELRILKVIKNKFYWALILIVIFISLEKRDAKKKRYAETEVVSKVVKPIL